MQEMNQKVRMTMSSYINNKHLIRQITEYWKKFQVTQHLIPTHPIWLIHQLKSTNQTEQKEFFDGQIFELAGYRVLEGVGLSFSTLEMLIDYFKALKNHMSYTGEIKQQAEPKLFVRFYKQF